ncbi:hypothetical protein [Sediminivirga luteola]|uniref:Uncharacterized protein n=1 Tax=Sediminivirga luteola TaxID=1774748 RepID=A0A8J2XLN5_9MICO|nr:hypothetical protein [Sediminivirga luteola]MCI2265399.1 hypothetical protein [Sediminivirga luteola]GGA24259.1 hypothetical protein GCM10011333_29080 [Sediminivirga luteola]
MSTSAPKPGPRPGAADLDEEAYAARIAQLRAILDEGEADPEALAAAAEQLAALLSGLDAELGEQPGS